MTINWRVFDSPFFCILLNQYERSERRRAFEEKFADVIKDAENPWAKNSWIVSDLKKLYPNADEDDLETIIKEAKAIGYGRDGTMMTEELEEFCRDAGVDPEAVNAISASTSSSFARAQSNSTRNGYDY